MSLFEPWSDFYGHSKLAETIVQFLHIGGLVLAGGVAIAADRGTLRALRVAAAERHGHLRELAAVHRWVLTGLAIVVVSGLALLAADLETFFGSWIFWVKMALVVALLVNGFVMTRTERTLQDNAIEGAPQWKTLHRVAVSSLTLWLLTAAFGVALTNYS
ncbi:MAG TPA: DUF6644 family protein [Phototrophicaceae bacterium]|nr:DUF6644 family protein [Phototrophicaceae bacterium]